MATATWQHDRMAEMTSRHCGGEVIQQHNGGKAVAQQRRYGSTAAATNTAALREAHRGDNSGAAVRETAALREVRQGNDNAAAKGTATLRETPWLSYYVSRDT